MVIASLPPLPKQLRSLLVAHECGGEPPDSLLLEFKLDDLDGLFACRFKFPVLDGVKAGLNQYGMTADGTRALHPAIRSDIQFNFDPTGKIHSPGKFGELRVGLELDFALTFLDA